MSLACDGPTEAPEALSPEAVARLQRQACTRCGRGASLSALADSLHVSVLFEDDRGRVIVASPRVCALFALPPVLCEGADAVAFVSLVSRQLRDPAAFVTRADALRAARAPAADELRLLRGVVLAREYLPVTDGGVFRGHLWIFRDITALRRAEDDRRAALHELDALRRERDGLLARLARALPTARTSTAPTLPSAARLPDDFDLRALVTRVCEPLRARAADDGVALHWTLASDLHAALRGDAPAVGDALVALVSVALAATHAGAVLLRVRTNPAPDGAVTLRAEVFGSVAGLAQEPLAHAPPRPAPGEGALARCRSLALRVGGAVEARRAPGGDSELTLTLRLDPAARAAPVAPQPVPAPRVLIAEDNEVNQMILRHLVEALGFRAVSSTTGPETVARVAEGDLAAVLLDWHMEGFDGPEVTRRVRAAEAAEGRSPVSIIAVTASTAAGTRERCLAAGMDDYLPKPVTAAGLSRVLGAWLPIARAAAASSPAAPTTPEGPPAGGSAAREAVDVVALRALVPRAKGGALMGERLFQLFERGASRHRTALHDALARLDRDALGQAAHGLLGACGTVRAVTAASLAGWIESVHARASEALLRALVEALDEALDEAQRVLRAELTTHA